jgi:hypothetical protein
MARDCDINDFDSCLRNFNRGLRGVDVGLLFYSGHAIQLNGENYLVPVDARLEDPEDLEKRAFKLSTQLADMRSVAHVSLVFLDACRDNPFPLRGLDAYSGTKGVVVRPTGLKEVKKSDLKDALIAFAAEQGHTAADGKSGEPSPFTKALLEFIETPGLEINEMMRRVRRRVREGTNGKQVPWSEQCLDGEFYFSPSSQPGLPYTHPARPQSGSPDHTSTERADPFWIRFVSGGWLKYVFLSVILLSIVVLMGYLNLPGKKYPELGSAPTINSYRHPSGVPKTSPDTGPNPSNPPTGAADSVGEGPQPGPNCYVVTSQDSTVMPPKFTRLWKCP